MGSERARAHTLANGTEYYGLAHIIDVWRALDPQQRRVGAGLAPELVTILERSDRHLVQNGQEWNVNESATVTPRAQGGHKC